MNFLNDFASEILIAILFTAGAWLYGRYKDGKFGQLGRGMKVSPDRSKIVSEISGDLILTSQSGTRNLTHTPNVEADAIWANNSRWIAFRKSVNGEWHVWVIDSDTGKSVGLAMFPKSRPIGWSERDDLIIDLGGSEWIIKRAEIERKLA